jgi:hypothetical protein
LSGGLSLQPIATATGTILRVAVTRADPLELVAIDAEGSFFAYDDAAGLRLLRPSDAQMRSKIADLEVLEPGHAIGIHSELGVLYRYRDGAVTVEAPSPLIRMRGVGQAAGLGALVTTYDDDVFLDDGSGWRLLGKTTLTLPTDVVEVPTGFLIGSDLGAVEEYATGVGFCSTQALGSQGDVPVVGAPLGGGAVFVSLYNRDTPLLALFVKRASP